jgi:hypothetical protein
LLLNPIVLKWSFPNIKIIRGGLMAKKNLIKKLSFVGTILFIVISLSVSVQGGYVFKQSTFNGGDYNLKNKEFNDGALHWAIINGKGDKADSGRIGSGLRVTGSSSGVTIYQKLDSHNIQFLIGRYLTFGCYFKGTNQGDEFRVSIKYSYVRYIRYYERVLTSTVYSEWESKSSYDTMPWRLCSIMQNIPSNTFEIYVEMHIRNTVGKTVDVLIDDAEISMFFGLKTTEQFSYYHYYTNTRRSAEIKYGVSVNVFEQETLSGDHNFNQMTLSVNTFGTATGMVLYKMALKIELLPKTFYDPIPFWPWDGWWYSTQYGDLNVLKIDSFDNRLGIYGGTSSNLVNDIAFRGVKFGYNFLVGKSLSLLTGNPIVGIIGGKVSDLTSDFVASLMTGRAAAVDNILDASGQISDGDSIDVNEGKDYYTQYEWNFISMAGAPYPLQGYVYDIASTAFGQNYLQWTYLKGQSGYKIHISATFYWGHIEGGGYQSVIFSKDGTTTKELEIVV